MDESEGAKKVGGKILRFFSTLGVGGVQKQFLQVLKTGVLKEFDISICCFSPPLFLEADYQKEKVAVFKNISKGKYNPLTLIKLCRLLKKHKIEIAHVSKMEDIIPLTTLAARICNVRLLIHYHFPYSWKSRRKKLLDRICAKSANTVICVSRHVSYHIARNLEIFDEKKQKIIYNGFTPRKVQRSSPTKSQIKIILISRLEKFKKIETFIEAMRIVVEKRRDTTAAVVGDGRERKRLREIARDIEQISWLGSRKEVEELINQSDIGVLPSAKEGLGNVVLEYMALSVAPVVSGIPAIMEITPDHHTSLMFEPKNSWKLASCILRLTEAPKLRKIIATNARKRSKRFSIFQTALKLRELYRDVLERQKL